jgi:nucleoside phosphorylase
MAWTSGDGLVERQRAEGSHVDVAVLTVIPAELEAARAALAVPDTARIKDEENGTVYHSAVVRSEIAARDYSILLSCIGGAGNLGSAAAVGDTIAKYRPRAVLLVGIAARIRGKVRIGDVVLSERVVAYEPAALVRAPDGSPGIQRRSEIDRTPHEMTQDVVNYRQDARRLKDIFLRSGGQFPEAPKGQENEFREHVARTIGARIGTIASGEKLLRDPAKLLAVRSEIHGKTEVGEMEAAGVVEACRRANVPWLVVRGISDFGDELKDDRFHDFAARAAAAVLVDFLAHGLDLGAAPEKLWSGSTEKDPFRTFLSPGRERHRSERPVFIFGRPIDRDQDFIGRAHECDTILESIEQGQPVQILGESLMGKTSLLRWVQRNAVPDRPAIWVDPTQGLSPASMVKAIAEALGKAEHAAAVQAPGASSADAAGVLTSIVPFVLLMDDADALATLGRGFDVEFFNVVRSLVQGRKLTWVSAARRNLYDLFKGKGLTSDFLNDARKIWVGPLREDASLKLAALGATEAVDADVLLRGDVATLQILGHARAMGDQHLSDGLRALALVGVASGSHEQKSPTCVDPPG